MARREERRLRQSRVLLQRKVEHISLDETKEKKTKKEKEKVPPFYWKTTVDKKTKREYYYNEKTNYCTWVMPEDPAIVAKMIRCANCGGFGQGLVKEHGFCDRCARELRVRKKPPPTKQRGGGQKKTLVL